MLDFSVHFGGCNEELGQNNLMSVNSQNSDVKFMEVEEEAPTIPINLKTALSSPNKRGKTKRKVTFAEPKAKPQAH
jgi:hypothetical protein